jgi:ribosome-associated translation inhibitor RaiA
MKSDGGYIMKNLKATELVNAGVAELSKIAPKNAEIEIDVKEDPIGHYATHVKIKTKFKTYFAKKEDDSFVVSLHKAMRALKSQIKKQSVIHRHRKIQFES